MENDLLDFEQKFLDNSVWNFERLTNKYFSAVCGWDYKMNYVVEEKF